MQSDFKVEKMPAYRFPRSERNERDKRIWQVVMIERDEWGAYVKDIEVRRSSLNWDEATRAWNDLVQELQKAEREKKKE